MGLRGQVWLSDFAIAMVVFALALLIFFVYMKNVINIGEKDVEALAGESRFVGSQLTKQGIPAFWNYDPRKTQRIGFTGEGQEIDSEKFIAANTLAYDDTKALLGIISDFFVFFQDEAGRTVSVGGQCGFGSPAITIPESPAKIAWGAAVGLSTVSAGLAWACDQSYGFNSAINFHVYRLLSPTKLELDAGWCTAPSPPNPPNTAFIPAPLGVYPSPIPPNMYPPALPTSGSTNAMNASALFLTNLTNGNFDVVILESSTFNGSERENITQWVKKGGTLFLVDWWCDERYPGCEDGKSYAGVGAHFNNSYDLDYSLDPEKYAANPALMRVNATFVPFKPIFKIPFGAQFQWIPSFDVQAGAPPPKALELAAVNRLRNNSAFVPFATYVNHPYPEYNVLDIPTIIPSSYDPFPMARWRFYDGTVYYFAMNRTEINTSNANPCLHDDLYLDMASETGPLIPLTDPTGSGTWAGPPGHPINDPQYQYLINFFTTTNMINLFAAIPPPIGPSPYYINCKECYNQNIGGIPCDPRFMDPIGLLPHPLWDPPDENNYLDQFLDHLNQNLVRCSAINISSIKFDNLVPTSRVVRYNDKLLNMVVYAWK